MVLSRTLVKERKGRKEQEEREQEVIVKVEVRKVREEGQENIDDNRFVKEKIDSNCLITNVIGSLFILSNNINSEQMAYYKFGPNESLNVLGIAINNYSKYTAVITFCAINSIMRTTIHNILSPWVVNSVQDVTKKKDINIHYFAYEAVYVITIYSWIDWYIYINVLLSQADIFLVEIASDLIMAGIVTRYYLTKEFIRVNEKGYELV